MKNKTFTEIFTDKKFETEEAKVQIVAHSAFVRELAGAALDYVFKEAEAYDSKVAPLLISRVVNMVYQYHYGIMLNAKEK